VPCIALCPAWKCHRPSVQRIVVAKSNLLPPFIMSPTEQRAILTIALLAAFADGMKDDREREAIKRVAESLAGPHDAPQLAEVYQAVLLRRVDLAQAVAAINDPGQRQLAYELAVGVCDADDERNDAERQFLNELKQALGLPDATTTRIERDADSVACAPLSAQAAPMSPAMAASSSLGSKEPNLPETELDKYILNHAMVNGALELLPQSLASMAIIGLQIKLVYRIGKAYGHELDKGHIKEFIATAGVGLTSQYIEQIGRKLLGGLLGGIAGGLGRGLGKAASGVAFSFATTYALGQLAKRYYAGGRQMDQALLRETYESLLVQAKQLQGQYAGEIQQKARTLDLAQVMSMR
jgi:uncharacterized protein (DUF697 family)/tellurite resistance protein